MKDNPLKRILLFCLCIFIVFNCSENSGIELGDESGHLVIIGGGSRPDRIMKTITDLGKLHDNGKIVVIPNASASPERTGENHAAELAQFTDKEVTYFVVTPDNVNQDSTLKHFEGVGGIFFSGGVQSRLTGLLNGTKLLERIREIYSDGGVLSGSSAGAAIMSDLMLTGSEIRYEGDDRLKTIEAANIAYVKGFGFMKGVIIDQHFVKRQRENRLISLVLDHSEYIGIGIDEQTAIIRKPGNTFEVIGNSNVLVFDATQASIAPVDTTRTYIHSADGLKFHILKEGQVFDLKKLRVVK
ncbi:cyanophycinase [candidate division KSB1 bacterium]